MSSATISTRDDAAAAGEESGDGRAAATAVALADLATGVGLDDVTAEEDNNPANEQ